MFPITSIKVALFLCRALDTPLGAAARQRFPQPTCAEVASSNASQPSISDDPTTSAALLALPIANGIDRTSVRLGPGEGYRVNAELVRCWVDAMNYASIATQPCWAQLADLGRSGASQASPSLAQCPLLREVINATESARTMPLVPQHMLQSNLYQRPSMSREQVQAGTRPRSRKNIVRQGHGHEKEIRKDIDTIRKSRANKNGLNGAKRWVKGGKEVAGPISAAPAPAGSDA